jgi:ribonuclease E
MIPNPSVLVIESNGLGVKKLPDKVLPERAKPSRLDSIKMREDKPPEIISVNMTTEEQDVFAFMGISPLILFEGEIKSPRTAVIEIHPPGYVSSDTSESNDNGHGNGDGATVSLPEEVAATVALEVDLPSEVEPLPREEIKEKSLILKVTPAAAKPEVTTNLVESVEQSIDLPIPEAPLEPSQEELESAPRRRRRRSSAEVDKAKQLSLETES